MTTYRDRAGQEADILVDQGDAVQIVEVKAGQTITGEMFRSLGQVSEVLSKSKSTARVLVYAGDTSHARQGATVLPWDAVDRQSW